MTGSTDRRPGLPGWVLSMTGDMWPVTCPGLPGPESDPCRGILVWASVPLLPSHPATVYHGTGANIVISATLMFFSSNMLIKSTVLAR